VASIQFSTDNRTVHSNDATAITKAVASPGMAVDSGRGSTRQVQVNTHGQAFVQFGEGGSTRASSGVTSVNMALVGNGASGVLATAQRNGQPIAPGELRDSDTVEGPTGLRTSVGNARRLGWINQDRAGNVSNPTPEQLQEASRAAEAERQAAAEKAAQDAEKERIDLNRFPDDAAEAAAQHFAGEVAADDKIAAMVQMHRDGQLSESMIHRLSEQMHLSPDEFVAAWNAMALNTQAQLAVLARANKIDVNAFASWMRSTRSSESLSAMRQHALGRDLVGAWQPHIDAFKARGGR
jgi:hypothetical protein